MNFCPYCGSPLEGMPAHCPVCGTPLAEDAPQPNAPSVCFEPPVPPQDFPVQPPFVPQQELPPQPPLVPPMMPPYAPYPPQPFPTPQPAPEESLSTAGYLGALVLFAIPIVGLILLVIWSFADGPKPELKKLARAYLLRRLIGYGVAVILGVVFSSLLSILLYDVFY